MTEAEFEALLAVPDQHTGARRRDRTVLMLALQTGLRVSERSGLCWHDITLGTGAPGRWQGKGRQERWTPLRQDTIAALRAWQRAQQSPDWLATALERVLRNTGSQTPGVEGVTLRQFTDEAFNSAFLVDIADALKHRTYTPQPCRRVYIPKPHKPIQQRP